MPAVVAGSSAIILYDREIKDLYIIFTNDYCMFPLLTTTVLLGMLKLCFMYMYGGHCFRILHPILFCSLDV